MSKRLIPIIRVIISLSLIIILLYMMRGNYGQIFSVWRNTNLAVFGSALLLFVGANTLAALRLKTIIEAQEIPATFLESLSLVFIGYFFNNFLPTAIGGDMVKAYYLSKRTHLKMGAVASIFVDRLIGLLTMVFMAFIALIFVDDSTMDPMVRYTIYAITAVAVIALLFMVNKKVAHLFSFFFFFLRPFEEKLRKAYDTVNTYRKHKLLMAQSFGISIVSQVLFFMSIGTLALSIGQNIPLKEIFLRVPIVSMLSLLPSINGLGLREGATVVLFGPLIGKENAFAVSILQLAVLFIVSIIGGIVYAASPQFKIKLKEVNKELEANQ